MHVRQRHLRRRHEPEVLLGVVVEVVAELRELARVPHRLFLDHRRQVHLRVAVLVDVQLEHEGDQRALQPRAGALEHVEAAAGQLRPALEVDDVERLAQLVVRLAPVVAVLLARLIAHACWRARPRRTASRRPGCSGSPSRARSAAPRPRAAPAPARRRAPRRVFISAIMRCRSTGILRGADLLAGGVLLGAQPLRLGQQVAPPHVQLEDLVERAGRVAGRRAPCARRPACSRMNCRLSMR